MARLTHETVMGGGFTSRSRILLSGQRLILRTGGTFLGLWRLAYRWTARAAAAYLIWGEKDAAVYARGSVGTGDLVPGLSDIDLAIVLAEARTAAGAGAPRATRRWERLRHALPATALLVDGPLVFEQADFHDLAAASVLTYGLDGVGELRPDRAGYFGTDASFDRVKLLERPGLYAPTFDWDLLRGPDRRPTEPLRDRQMRRIAGWLELLYWWRWVYPLCIDPAGPRAAYQCVKLVAEPARIWLWLAHGEAASGREDVLEKAIRRMPEEEDILRKALGLRRRLARSPAPPLIEVLPAVLRISVRIVGLIDAEAQDADHTEVRLAGADPPELILGDGGSGGADVPPGTPVPNLFPIADWRALTCPLLPDECFELLPGDPGDPAVLRAAAISHRAGPYPALRGDGLMLFPAGPALRSRMRAIRCRATDPVSFALVDGRDIARFPDLRGWSARDTAVRGVAEHRAWLRAAPGSWGGSAASDSAGRALGMLLSAARAGLFLETATAGDPELALTVTEAARRIAARSSAARTVAEEALGHYREFAARETPPPASTVTAFRELVLGLPAYGSGESLAVGAAGQAAA